MKEEIENLIKKGYRSLEVAEEIFNHGHYDFAVSRAYYAMFYLAEAALLSKGLSFSKHSAVIAAFNQQFVKTGVFPKKLHAWFIKAFDKRNIGDYGSELTVTKEESKEVLEQAEEFIRTVENYLKSKN
jgi:uncharacterized protein (UPF0332 family)